MAITPQQARAELARRELARRESKKQEASSPQQSQQMQSIQPQNILGQLFNVPAAAMRSAIQGKGYAQGAAQPDQVPKFQELAAQGASDLAGRLPQGIAAPVGGLMSSIGQGYGMAADIATDPAALLAMLIGKAPVGGTGTELGKMISATKPAQAVGRFMGKERHLSNLKNIFKLEGELSQAKKAKVALDATRDIIGKAKALAIQEVKDVPAELNFGGNMSQKIVDAIKNPIYGVEFTQEGGVVNTVGNLDKVKEAVGDLISSPKLWQEAPKKEIGMIKKFYGEIVSSMKSAANKAGKPIDSALDNYGKFMDNFHKINDKLVDKYGNAMGNKLKESFKLQAEPALKQAWREVSKASPEIKSVMKSMNSREMLRALLSAGTIYEGGKKILTGKF